MNSTRLAALLYYFSQNSRIKAAMYLLLVAIIVLVLETFIWSISKFNNTELHNDVLRQRNLLYKQEQMNELNTHLQQTLPFIESIEKKYQSAPGQSDVMKQLSRLVREHHLRMQSQTVTVVANENDNSSINSIELMVAGRYPDIRAMLGTLPTMSAWVEVADIRLEKVNKTQVGAKLRLLLIRESTR